MFTAVIRVSSLQRYKRMRDLLTRHLWAWQIGHKIYYYNIYIYIYIYENPSRSAVFEILRPARLAPTTMFKVT